LAMTIGYVVFTVMFCGGALAYWLVSAKLKD
jgi:hypothetical protein